MKTFWYDPGGLTNYGDMLTPALLERAGIAFEWAAPADASLVMVGSILAQLPNRWAGTVLGSGFIRDGQRRDLSRARVLAVRGPATARLAGLPASVPLGDPGILAPTLLAHRPPADLDRVIVPHYVDEALARRFRGSPVIRIQQRPIRFLAQIARAREVVTSSLHALIAADALGIPHVWIPCPAVVGGAFKFRDYAGAFDAPMVAGRQRLTDPTALAARAAVLTALIASLPGRDDPSSAAAPDD